MQSKKNIQFCGPLLKEKAIQIPETVGDEEFRINNGWLVTEVWRSSDTETTIVFKSICGKLSDVSKAKLGE